MMPDQVSVTDCIIWCVLCHFYAFESITTELITLPYENNKTHQHGAAGQMLYHIFYLLVRKQIKMTYEKKSYNWFTHTQREKVCNITLSTKN